MGKRDAVVKPSTGLAARPQGGTSGAAQLEARQQFEREVVNVGKSVVIKGELTASEDVTIDGKVEGKIELKDHVLTIGPNGKIKAELFAKVLVVLGEVNGNITASEKVEIHDGGSVEGDIVSPRLAIAEGAHFRGRVRFEFDVERKDHFGRTLAYVYLPDGPFLNAEIVKQGYGHAYTQFPFRYSVAFQGYEREAREDSLGLGAAESAPTSAMGDVRVWVNTASGVYHCPGTQYYGQTRRGSFLTQDEAQREGYRAAYGRACR
jgi:cytoskeletal protein CcmA (bactofilin family)